MDSLIPETDIADLRGFEIIKKTVKSVHWNIVPNFTNKFVLAFLVLDQFHAEASIKYLVELAMWILSVKNQLKDQLFALFYSQLK